MEYIPAKQLLLPSRDDSWFGARYTMNIYRGCNHGCIYCDSRCECYRVEDFDTVRAKENVIPLLRSELKGKKQAAVVTTGSMSDPYNPFEQELQLTRQALEELARSRFGVVVNTKSTLVTRDLEVLQRISQHAPTLVNITITTAQDDLTRRLERFAPSTSERFVALRTLSAGGITCGLLLMPLLPMINDNAENVLAIVQRAADAGVSYIYPGFGVTLRGNQRDYYFDQIEQIYPGLSHRYLLTYGDEIHCAAGRVGELYAAFEQACTQCGLLWRMEDIIAFSRKRTAKEQVSLFELM